MATLGYYEVTYACGHKAESSARDKTKRGIALNIRETRKYSCPSCPERSKPCDRCGSLETPHFVSSDKKGKTQYICPACAAVEFSA